MLNWLGVGGVERQWSEIEEVGTVATGDHDHLPHLQVCIFLKPLSGLKEIPVDPSTASLLTTQVLPWGWPDNFQLGQSIVWLPVWVSIKDKTRRTRMKLWHEKSVLVMGRNSDVRQIMKQPQIVECPPLFPFHHLTNWIARRQDGLCHPPLGLLSHFIRSDFSTSM